MPILICARAMQSSTPMPIDSFLFDFPIEMPKSAEDPAWQSDHAPDQIGSGILDNPLFDFQAFASFDGDAVSSQIKNRAPSQDTTYANVNTNQCRDTKTGESQGNGGAEVGETDYARSNSSTAIQNAHSYLTHASSDNMAVPVSDFSAFLPDPGHYGPFGNSHGFIGSSTNNVQHNLTQDNIGLSLEHYNVQANLSGSSSGTFAPDSQNCTQPGLSLRSEHLRNGRPSALVVIWEGPAFNIPTDVAYKLAKMYGH